jgi:DNA-binding Xre family transcriptional regulator
VTVDYECRLRLLRVLVVLCEILDCEPGELVRRTSVTVGQ